MKPGEIVVEAHKQTLHKVDILGRNDYAQGIGAQNEDGNRGEGADNHCLGVVDCRVLDFPYVHAAHFHAGIEQENGYRQNNIIEVGKVGNEVAMPVHLRLASGGEIYHSAHHQQSGGHDCAHKTAYLGHLSDPAHALE